MNAPTTTPNKPSKVIPSLVTETRYGETQLPFVNTTGNVNGIITLPVSRVLTQRKIYCFFYAAGSAGNTTNFYMNGAVSFWTGSGTIQLGSLPVCYGNLASSASISGRSLPSCFNVGGSPGPDCVTLILGNTAGTGITSNPIMQPLYCDAVCDTIQLDLLDSGGMGGSPNGLVRAYLMVISSRPREGLNPKAQT